VRLGVGGDRPAGERSGCEPKPPAAIVVNLDNLKLGQLATLDGPNPDDLLGVRIE
jgi:hypothetical protein